MESNDRFLGWLKKNDQKEQWLGSGVRLTGRYKIAGRYEGKKELKTKDDQKQKGEAK